MHSSEQELQHLLVAGVLVMLRLGSALVTLPVYNSAGIPARVKVLMVLVLTVVVVPVAAFQPHADVRFTSSSLASEVVVGLCFGLTLMLLSEAILFGASLMSSAFSFSLANLLDPNSNIETEVLGTVLNWFSILVLLTAGLHRTMLAALLRTFVVLPLGHAPASFRAGELLTGMVSGIFLAGMQLAAPVTAAALLVEVAVGLVSRMAPALPAQIASVPIKTIVSYVVLIGGLALWPMWIERHFTALLDVAEKAMRT